jgi:hypothetical protein
MTAKQQYLNKTLYDEFVLSKDFFNQNFIDFDNLNRYGTVDTKNNLISVRADKIAPIDDKGKQQALSFVALAYGEMLKEIKDRVSQGSWETDSIFTRVQAQSSYQSPYEGFDQFMTEQFQKMTGVIYKNRNITTFGTFLNVFAEFLAKNSYDFPFTFAGFMESNNNPKASGLTIEFVEGQKNNFDLKQIFVQDPGFKRYLLLAEKYGFYVNRNYPWTMMANMDSPAMQIYASQDSGINIGTEGIIKRYFDSASDISYNSFVNYLAGFYNSVATSEPTFTYLKYVNKPCTKYESTTITREVITEATLPAIQKANENLLQLLYFKIRFYETFRSNIKFQQALRLYYSIKPYRKIPFGTFVEKLVGPAKNSNLMFYSPTGKTTPKTYEDFFEAEEVASQLGCEGAHQTPNGRYLPCKTPERYLELTSL